MKIRMIFAVMCRMQWITFLVTVSIRHGFSVLQDDMTSLLALGCPGYTGCDVTSPDSANTSATLYSCCLPCSCDINSCSSLNSCCPDLKWNHVNAVSGSDGAFSAERKCVPTMLTSLLKSTAYSIGKPSATVGILMVTGCAAYTNDSRCTEPNLAIMGEGIPVTSVSTRLTYRNKYCGECNGHDQNDLLAWTPYLTCSGLPDTDEFPFSVSMLKLFRKAASHGHECGLSFLPPPKIKDIIKIDICFDKTSTINQCPDTYTNDTIKQACAEFHMPFVSTVNRTVSVYGNYFCYLCNNDDIGDENHCTEDLSTEILKDDRAEYVLEININLGNDSAFLGPWQQPNVTASPLTTDGVICNGTTTYDPYQRKCREWYCPVFRQAVGNSCVPFISDVLKATFRVQLMMSIHSETLNVFIATNKKALAQAILSHIFGHDSQPEIIVLSLREDPVYMFASVLVSMSRYSTSKSKVFDQRTYGRSVTIVTVHGAVTVTYDLAVGITVDLDLNDGNHNGICVTDLQDNTLLANIYTANIAEFARSLIYTTVSKLSFCAQVSFRGRMEINDYVDSIVIRASAKILTVGQFVRESDINRVRVCLSDYLKTEQLSFMADTDVQSDTNTQKNILSIACNLLSMTGLVLTLITYAVFDELRSIPGKKIMLLAFHLILAQSLFVFGVGRTEHPVVCIAIGVCAHLFWLIAIFWMNACTFHMFRTFVTVGQPHRSKASQLCQYTIYCYSMAGLMVAITMSVSMYRSDGHDIGYGGDVCYIKDPGMVGWVFALPVCVVVIVNAVLFFVVICHISTSSMRVDASTSSRSVDRAYAAIYMRLSSLTGVTWIFGFLFIWTRFEPLEYMFIFFNASQGVFIFIAFICTERVKKLYRDLFMGHGTYTQRVCCCRCVWPGSRTRVWPGSRTPYASLVREQTVEKRLSSLGELKSTQSV